MVWLAVACGLLLLLAFEGIICIVMALPVAVPVVLLGSAVGYFIQSRPMHSADSVRLMLVPLAALPCLIGAESATHPEAPLFCVRTRVEVRAAPNRVWPHVIRFNPLPRPSASDWVFRTGVAYPVKAEIEGQGVGAIRRCEFSTGPFIEPIEIWDEPRLLRFAVTSNPAPMREWNPLFEIHPPHLDRFLVALRGQFRLTELPGGKTLLEGTTWYQHHLWPAAYWRLWSDSIIHKIHQRVLLHIKQSAEREPYQHEPISDRASSAAVEKVAATVDRRQRFATAFPDAPFPVRSPSCRSPFWFLTLSSHNLPGGSGNGSNDPSDTGEQEGDEVRAVIQPKDNIRESCPQPGSQH